MRGRSLPKWPVAPGDPGWPTCKCGCGEPVKPRPKGSVKDGTLPGQPFDYKRGHTSRAQPWLDGLKRCGACEQFKSSDAFRMKQCGSLTRDCGRCLDARNAEYRRLNPDIIAANHIAYREAHREQYAQRARDWRRANPEWASTLGRRTTSTYQARKLGQWIEHIDALIVLERDDGVCGICGGDVDPFDFHVDHIWPISKGGLHAYWNVQAAHPGCNARKHNRL